MLEGTVLVVYLKGCGTKTAAAFSTDTPRAIKYAWRQCEDDFDFEQDDVVSDAAGRFFGREATDVLPAVLDAEDYHFLKTHYRVGMFEQVASFCVAYDRLDAVHLDEENVFATAPAPPEAPPGAEFGEHEFVITVNQQHPSGTNLPFPLITASFGAYMAEIEEYKGMFVGETFVPFPLNGEQQLELLDAARGVYNASVRGGWDAGATPATLNTFW